MKTYYVAGVALMLGCTACAGPKLNGSDAILIEQARYTSHADCVRAVATAEAREMQTIAGMDAQIAGMAFMASAMAKQAQALSGKHPCDQGGTNYYDYAARVAEAQNKALSSVTGSVVSGAVIGTGIVAGADVLKSALNNAGTHVNTNMQGDNNSNSHTTYDTKANTDNHVNTQGDNSPVAVSNPPVTGPDQSTTTTVHEAPAETPAAPAP